MLLSTHVVQDVDHIARELILLSGGRVLRKAPGQVLTGELEGKVWEVSLPEEALETVGRYGALCGVIKTERGLLVRLLAEERPPFPCQPAQPGLEDVYLRQFGREAGYGF